MAPSATSLFCPRDTFQRTDPSKQIYSKDARLPTYFLLLRHLNFNVCPEARHRNMCGPCEMDNSQVDCGGACLWMLEYLRLWREWTESCTCWSLSLLGEQLLLSLEVWRGTTGREFFRLTSTDFAGTGVLAIAFRFQRNSPGWQEKAWWENPSSMTDMYSVCKVRALGCQPACIPGITHEVAVSSCLHWKLARD